MKEENKKEKPIGIIGCIGNILWVLSAALWVGGTFSGNPNSMVIGMIGVGLGLILYFVGKKLT